MNNIQFIYGFFFSIVKKDLNASEIFALVNYASLRVSYKCFFYY